MGFIDQHANDWGGAGDLNRVKRIDESANQRNVVQLVQTSSSAHRDGRLVRQNTFLIFVECPRIDHAV